MSSAKEIAQLIAKSSKVVVLTGAGFSTASGIKDYRSSDGLWSEEKQMKMSSLTGLEDSPKEFWGFWWERIFEAIKLNPNPAHFALRKLEELGFVDYVLTQNIDDFHRQSGISNLLHLHGHLFNICSLDKKKKFTVQQAWELACLSKDRIPYDPETHLILRPDVVFFGEDLQLELLSFARQLCTEADLLLVFGSSLSVPPVSQLPTYAYQNEGKTVIINQEETYIDSSASIVSRNDIVIELPQIVQELKYHMY